MPRNDKSHISGLDLTLYADKWVVFVSKNWLITPIVTTIIASHHSLEGCFQQQATQLAIAALLPNEAIISHFISSKPIETEFP